MEAKHYNDGMNVYPGQLNAYNQNLDKNKQKSDNNAYN
jgi:hypothetical protein